MLKTELEKRENNWAVGGVRVCCGYIYIYIYMYALIYYCIIISMSTIAMFDVQFSLLNFFSCSFMVYIYIYII